MRLPRQHQTVGNACRCLPYDPGNPSCSYECSNVEPSLQQGVFEFQALTTDWEMQKHIRCVWEGEVSG